MENTTQPATQPVPAALISPTELFSYAWTLFKKHWRILVEIVVVPYSLIYLGNIIMLAHVGILSVIGVLCTIVGIIFAIAMYPGLANAISRLSVDPSTHISTKEQFRFGFGYFWSFILIALIVGFASIGSFVIFVIPGFVISIYAGMYMFTLAVDGKKGFSALTESYSLVKGRWWATFGRVLFMAVPVCIAAAVFLGVTALIVAGLGVSMTSPVGTIIRLIFNLIMIAAVLPFAFSYQYKLYSALKATRLSSVPAGAFKGWLIAFLVIGIVFFISLPLVGAAVLFHSAARERGAAMQGYYQAMQADMKDMPMASGTAPMLPQ